jgi:protoheme IX farnesyltransferase
VCGRAHVGLGHVCLSGSGCHGHTADTVAEAARFEREGRMRIAATAPQSCYARSSATAAAYWALTKPDINFLIAIVTFAGAYLGRPAGLHRFPFLLLIHTLLGTVLVSSGASALNQFIEWRFDAQMRRTARRPLAAGKEPAWALRFGLLLSFTGAIYLAVAVNVLSSLLAVFTLLSYLLLYTPLKRKTPWCTLAGAFSGAMPPLIG